MKRQRTVFNSRMTPCVRKGDSSVMRRVGSRTRERFPNTSCQLTGAAAFERRKQYRQLAGKIFNKVDAWVNTNPLRIPYVTIVLECEK